MIPHFTLQKGNQECLIIRMRDEFHIIDCNEALTKEKRLAVLESGCTPSQMQQMGLSGRTVPFCDIRTVFISGCGFQDEVIFKLKNRQMNFVFPQAYEQCRVDDFFRGIPRKQYKTRRKLRSGKRLDWRAREQDPQKLPLFRRIGIIWNALCGAMCMGLLFTGQEMYGLWFWAVLALMATGVYLNCAHGLYFAFVRYKGDDQDRGKGKVTHIGLGMLFLVMFAGLRSPYVVTDSIGLAIPALIAALVICLGLYALCRECREDAVAWFLSGALAVMLCGGVVIPHINHILGPETQIQTAEVVSKSTSRSRRSGRRYRVTVRLPDGETCTLRVSSREYEQIGHGNTFDLEVGEGFFGIGYVIDD